MNDYSVHICKKSELKELQQFINDHWRKNHILAVSKDMMDWQYYNNENGTYNFVIAKHLVRDEIDGVLGFITTHHFDNSIKEMDLWLALWKVRKGNVVQGLGFSLLNYLMTSKNPRSISVLGINRETIPVYKYLKFSVGIMNHYYMVNSNKSVFELIKNYKKQNQDTYHKESEIMMIRYKKSNFLELCNKSINYRSSRIIPVKTYSYIYQRYFCHPIYNYFVFGLKKNNHMVGIIVMRLDSYNSNNALRLVDLLGDVGELSGLYNLFQKLLQKYDAEYIDFYNIGIDEEILLSNGFVKRKSKNEIIIPNYFEPFKNINVDIEYAYKCDNKYNFNICKGDGDQDRPSIVNI